MSSPAALCYSANYIWLDPIDKIGKGATSTVYKCRQKNTGEFYAVKCFAHNSIVAKHQMREPEILRQLDHKNVMRMITTEKEETNRIKSMVIIMEYCAGGSVCDVLEKPEHSCGLPDDELILFILDIVAALKYLREKNVVHRDVKPGNILKYIDGDGRTFYKLTDFGAARDKMEDGDNFQSIQGTEEYLQPVMYERAMIAPRSGKPTFTATCDLWSLGVTIYHVAAGKLPFRPYGGRGNKELMYEITSKKKRGVISGVQLVDGGPVVYSDKLPITCRLTNACRLLITPMLAGLMENDESQMWSFDKLYDFAEKLRNYRYLELFVMSACTFDRVYIPGEIFASKQSSGESAAPGSTMVDRSNFAAKELVTVAMSTGKCTRLVKQHVSSQYAISMQECDLLIPTMTEHFSRGASTLIHNRSAKQSTQSAVDWMMKMANDEQLSCVAASLEHTRVRVALSERAASKTWSASAVLGAAFANADAGTDSPNSGFGLGASTKQYVVAMRKINVQLASSPAYVSDCEQKMDVPNTMMYDLRASMKQSDETTKSEETTELRSRTALAYSTFLASAALSDAQMLHCAAVNYFIVNAESLMNALRERADALNDTGRQIQQTVHLFKAFADSQIQLLELCEREYSRLDTSQSAIDGPLEDPLAVLETGSKSGPASLYIALEKLRNAISLLTKLQTDCSKKQDEVKMYVSKYYDVVVTRDELRKRWYSKVAEKLCFGECITAGLAADTISTDANSEAKGDSAGSNTLPCWKRLQTTYEQCTSLYGIVHDKYMELIRSGASRNSASDLQQAVNYDRRLLRKRSGDSHSHLTRHCWNRTQHCHRSFIEWYVMLDGAAKRIDSLRGLILRGENDQEQALRTLSDTCEDVTRACSQFYSDEKRNTNPRNSAGGPTIQRSEQAVQTSSADIPAEVTSIFASRFDPNLFENVSSRIDTLLGSIDALRLVVDDCDDGLDD